jgi:chaperonin cofactor prefoldin|tara:strand:+ start:583 stop:720 length:138 start_codon:yes stop_codon:yes gene_type:complete
MKKKIKSKDLHEVVEKLQQRVEDLENEHMVILKQLGRLQSQCEEA